MPGQTSGQALWSRPDKIATTRWQNILFVEEKKTGATARKQQHLIERSVQEKAAAVIIKQAVIQALMAGGAQATKKIGVKTTSYRGFRHPAKTVLSGAPIEEFSSKHRVYFPVRLG